MLYKYMMRACAPSRPPCIFEWLRHSSSILPKAVGGRMGRNSFLEPDPGKMHMHICRKKSVHHIWALFQKWLPRPNHSAHVIRIEILCKTTISMSWDVSSESKTIGANAKYSSLARMFTWSFMICPFHMFFTWFSYVSTSLWNMLFLDAILDGYSNAWPHQDVPNKHFEWL